MVIGVALDQQVGRLVQRPGSQSLLALVTGQQGDRADIAVQLVSFE